MCLGKGLVKDLEKPFEEMIRLEKGLYAKVTGFEAKECPRCLGEGFCGDATKKTKGLGPLFF